MGSRAWEIANHRRSLSPVIKIIFIISYLCSVKTIAFLDRCPKLLSVISSNRHKWPNADCQLCYYSPAGAVASTRRDAIFMLATEFRSSTEVLIRSFRTAGCRARIVIFAGRDFKPSAGMLGCDIEIVKEAMGARSWMSLVQIRFEWYHSYLETRRDEFDRILHLDSRDSFCFGDPFSVATDRDKLYLVGEAFPINFSIHNSAWVRRVYKGLNEKLLANTLVNGGAFVGGSDPVFYFLDRLVRHVEWSFFWGFGSDQASINYLVYGLSLPDAASRVMLDCDSSMPVMMSCYHKREVKFGQGGGVLRRNGVGPIYVAHQYDRFPEVVSMVSRMCGTPLLGQFGVEKR